MIIWNEKENRFITVSPEEQEALTILLDLAIGRVAPSYSRRLKSVQRKLEFIATTSDEKPAPVRGYLARR